MIIKLTRYAVGLLFVFVLNLCQGALAQQVDELIYIPVTRLEEAVSAAAEEGEEPLQVTYLEQRNDHASLMIRRTETSGPELHESFDDVYMVQDGAGILIYGGTYEGAETTEPGELRGGKISGGTRQPLAPGDIVVVPAGLPHQVEVEAGNTIIYHLLKIRRGN